MTWHPVRTPADAILINATFGADAVRVDFWCSCGHRQWYRLSGHGALATCPSCSRVFRLRVCWDVQEPPGSVDWGET